MAKPDEGTRRQGRRRPGDLRDQRRPGEENDLPGALPDAEVRGCSTCPIVGVALDDWDDEALREHAREAVEATVKEPDTEALDAMLARLTYVQGDYGDDATFERGEEGARRRQAAGLLPRDPALALRHRGQGPRQGGAGRARPRGDREALRPRPRIGPRAERGTLRGAGRGTDPADRPLPRQGAGDGHHLPALRQLDPRAGLEPQLHLPRADDDRRELRRRRPRPLLRLGRGDARRDPEPRPAGAGADRDGAAERQRPRLDPRQEARVLQGDAGGRPEALRARPVRRLPRGRRTSTRSRPPRPSPRSNCRSTTGAGAASPSSSARASACRRRRAR